MMVLYITLHIYDYIARTHAMRIERVDWLKLARAPQTYNTHAMTKSRRFKIVSNQICPYSYMNDKMIVVLFPMSKIRCNKYIYSLFN